MATLREWREGKKENGTNGVLSLREWSKRNGSQTRSAPAPAKTQPTIEDEPKVEGRHRPNANEWTREEAAAAAAEVQANDEKAAEERFGGMTTDELLYHVPTNGRDKNLYDTYMRSRTKVAESLERQSKKAKSAAASAGNDAEAYREFLGMPGASDEDIFGLAQAIRANNAQAKSLEPQKWLEYAEGLRESAEKKQSLAEQGRELKRRADAASEQGQVWEYSNVIKSYGELINSPDFAQKSQYVAPKESADDIWKKDKNDPRLRYMAINGDSHAQVGLQQEAWSTGDRGGVGNVFDLGGDNDYLFELTDMEKGVYNALYASSPEAADDFVEKLKPYLEVRARDTYAKRMAQIAREGPVGASIASVGMNLAQSGEYVLQLAELIGKGKINQNNAAYRASQMSNAVRGEVSKMAEEKWGKVGSAAYNLGMSMADFLTTTAVGGGTKAISLALMGTRAASNTVLNLKGRGLDDTAAFTLGSIAGAAEIVTESFSLEKLLNPNIVADGIAKNILKNFLTEASEEGAADVLNWAAEYIYDAITGNNEAEWKQKVYDAIQNGADPNDAVLAAIQGNLVQLGTDMLSGGISGGLMSAAGTPFYLNNFNASEQGQYANAIRGNEEGLQTLIQTGLKSPQNTEFYQRAQAALKQFADGKTPSALTIARLVEANQQQIDNDAAEQSGQGRLALPRTTPQEAPQTPQETRNTPGLTLPARTTQTAERAEETPRLTLPAAEQISAFGDEQDTAARAAQAESELVTRLRASNPGLLMDDYASGIDEAQRRAIDETAKRLGLRVGFSDTVSVGQDNAKIYDDGVVLIEKNNPNPIGFLYGHEMGHWLQQNSPEAYSEFSEAARATDPEWFKTREEATAAAYRDAGIEISTERIQEEVLSDYAGWLVQDEDVLNRFINQNKDKPNVLRRLYEAIKALAAKLTGRERRQATTAADLLLRAMNATEANVQNGIMSTGETRSSFGGLKAQYADAEAQARAEQMLGNSQGQAKNNFVRRKTGWFKGADGKWRFEIDDSGSHVNIDETMKHFTDDPEYQSFASLLYRENNSDSGLDSYEEWDRDTWASYYREKGLPQPSEVAQRLAAGHGKIGDILDHEELYRQYPFVANIPLGFEDLGQTTLGQVRYGAVILNNSLLGSEKELRRTLLHEIQHLIQSEEGFAKGANPRYWQGEIDRGMNTSRPSDVSAINTYRRIIAENPDLVRDVEMLNSMFSDNHAKYKLIDDNEWMDKETGELLTKDEVWGPYDGLQSELESKYGNTLEEYYDAIAHFGSPEDAEQAASTLPWQRTAFEMYQDTYGEAEARNVEERANLTPEQRMAIPPFSGKEDSVFVELGLRDRSKSSMKGLDAAGSPAYNRTALVTSETIDRWLRDYAAKGSPKYAQAYITRMTPKQFVDLTTSATGRLLIGDQTEALDAEKLIEATRDQPLQIKISDGEIVGHEGRHRATALYRAGVDSIPVLVFDYSNKYSKTDVPEMTIQGQDFGHSRSNAAETLRDLIPLSYENRDRIVQEYGTQPATERMQEKYNGRDTLRLSLKGLNADIAPASIQKYGQIPRGEKPARDINVPRKVTDKEDERVSWTARTVLEAKATPDAAIPAIAELVEKGAFSYRKKKDKAAIADAEATIRDKGWSSSYADWVKDVTAGKVSKANTAMGWALYNNAANAGDLDTALTVLDLMVQHQRNAAQALQASRILKQLSPEAQLYGVQRSVDNLIKELQERYGKKKNIDIQINRDLAQAFLDAQTEEERQKALEALYKDIGRQVPATFRDKWNAWRYLAMLANPRTHLRNISGNLGFAPVVFAKDQVATVLEGIASAVSKGKVERTKGLVLPVRDHDLVKAAWDRYQSVRDEALGGGKYNDSQMANRWIEEGRTIFKFKPLELARRGNSAALDAEDAWFSQPHYTYALAQYCKANGITPAQIRSGEGMGEADAYAIKEAQKATYRDINAFSDFVSSIGRTADRKTGVGKAASAVLEGVLPFRRTPANILVRGLEYSPIGLLKSLTYDISQVMRKDADGNPRMSVSEMLDDVSEGLTGTGILLLGGLLAKLGLLRGHGEDEKKERDYYDLMGFQNYALTLPNGESYTLDWLAPESLPLFVGVNIYEKLQQSKGDMNMSDLIDVVSQISEPMLEMSMLQSLNDMFESIGYAKENELSGLTQILSSAATSYLTQAIPTLLGQGERTGENLRMTTYTDKNKWLTKSMQYTLGKISAKVPGWDYGQVPYIDAWGRTEETGEGWVDRALKNMVNPAYTDKIRMSDMEKELLRLYELNPEDNGSVLATSHKASKYLTHNNERIDLTAEQYVDYATTKGQTAYSLMTDLVKTEEYKNASDEDKIKMVDSVYDYAATIAKGELLESLGNTYDDYEKLKAKLDKGADILDMIALTQEIKAADEAGNANSSYDTLEKLTAVEALGLPEAKAEPLLEQQFSEGQWAKYSTLKDAGVNYDTRLDIMREYAELDSSDEMKPGEKALEFSHYVDSLKLTSKQTQLVKDTYKFWSMVPAEAKRYEAFKQAGLSEDKSKHTAEVLGALKPLPGKEDVTDMQRYRAIESDKTLTNAEKIKVIGSIMGTAMKTESGNPSQWAKFNTALNNGRSLSQAIDLCENGRLDEFMKWTESAAKAQNVKWDVYDTFLKETAKLDGKDNGKSVNGLLKKRVVAYIDSLNLTPEQKDALLTDYNSTYKHDVTWHSGSYGSSSGSGRTYARANLSRLELPRTNTRQMGRLTLPTR